MEHASVMDMLPEEELVVCGQRGQAEAGDSGVGVGLYVAHCAACGRRFEYHGSMYRYRLDVFQSTPPAREETIEELAAIIGEVNA